MYEIHKDTWLNCIKHLNKMAGTFFLLHKFIIKNPKEMANRITFTRISWYSITANMAQRSQRGKRKDAIRTEDEVAWNGFECK